MKYQKLTEKIHSQQYNSETVPNENDGEISKEISKERYISQK